MKNRRTFRLVFVLTVVVLTSMATNTCFAQCYVAGWGSVLVVPPSTGNQILVAAPFSVLVAPSGAAPALQPAPATPPKAGAGLVQVSLVLKSGGKPKTGNLSGFPSEIQFDGDPAQYRTENLTDILVGEVKTDKTGAVTSVQLILRGPDKHGTGVKTIKGTISDPKKKVPWFYSTNSGFKFKPIHWQKLQSITFVKQTTSSSSTPPALPSTKSYPKPKIKSTSDLAA